MLRQIIGDLEPRCFVCDKDMPLRAQSGVTVERSQSKAVAKLRACEFFAQFCSIKRLQQVVMVLLRGADDWSEGKPVGVGQ